MLAGAIGQLRENRRKDLCANGFDEKRLNGEAPGGVPRGLGLEQAAGHGSPPGAGPTERNATTICAEHHSSERVFVFEGERGLGGRAGGRS